MPALLGRTEVLSGLFVILLGAAALLAVGDLDIGTLDEMGPGYVPRVLAWAMLAGGAAMTIAGIVERNAETVPPMTWRPVLLISLACAVFGLLVDDLGIVVATVASTAISTFAGSITRHRETPLLCAALAALAALVFVKGLGLAIPIWPR